MSKYVISIDQSTQSTKAILFDEKGNIVKPVVENIIRLLMN